MRLLNCLTTFALIGVLTAATLPAEETTLLITKNLFPEESVKYTSKYDIVDIIIPANYLNFEGSKLKQNVIAFFVEADTQPDGTRQYKGLYVLKDGNATKLLDNARVAAASRDGSSMAFFGASDGIYVYNEKSNSAEKYGSVTDSIIAIAKEGTGDEIYIVTENHEAYRVSEFGEKREKLTDIENAKQIVVDTENPNNLYFISNDNKAYVLTNLGVDPIQGLPENLPNAKFIQPPTFLEEGVLLFTDNKVYNIFDDAKSEWTNIKISPDLKITAAAPEVSVIQYYAVDKKLYEINFNKTFVKEVYDYLQSKETSIKTITSFP